MATSSTPASSSSISTQALERAAHTPGPWSILQNGDGYEVEARGRPHLMTVADIIGRPSVEIAANAHLIAAAPELLAALRLAHASVVSSIRSRLATEAGMSAEQISAMVDAHPTVIAIRAAIAKATGAQ